MKVNEHYFSAQPSSPFERSSQKIRIGLKEFQVELAPGVFSSQGLDIGTRVFLDKVPAPPALGCFADIGCGWGPLTLALASQSPQAQVWGVDVNARAIQLTKINAQANFLPNVQTLHITDQSQDSAPKDLDLIWSNPPIRIGRENLQNLLHFWMNRLKPEGVAYWVIAKNLGSDTIAKWMNQQGWQTEKIASAKGFRILKSHL